MNLQTKVEGFLSKARLLTASLKPEGTELFLMFNKDMYKEFRQVERHVELEEFLDGRKLHLVINLEKDRKLVSLVDVHSGDTLNLPGLEFICSHYDQFVKETSKDSEMTLLLICMMPDDVHMDFAPSIDDRVLFTISGYTIVDKS